MMDESQACVRYYSRFAFKAHGIRNFYVACDLDEGLVRYWPDGNIDLPRNTLLYSPNLDERAAEYRRCLIESESDYCIGVELNERDAAYLKEFLAVECLEKARGIDDEYMMAKTGGGWCYRDGWSVDFYAESDCGALPISLKDIAYCSFNCDLEPFEEIEDYLFDAVLGDHAEPLGYDAAKKLPIERMRVIASKSLSLGLDAIGEILWDGCSKLIRALGEVENSKQLSYCCSSDCFTIRYGNNISRGCGLPRFPNCIDVFGMEHVFRGADDADK